VSWFPSAALIYPAAQMIFCLKILENTLIQTGTNFRGDEHSKESQLRGGYHLEIVEGDVNYGEASF